MNFYKQILKKPEASQRPDGRPTKPPSREEAGLQIPIQSQAAYNQFNIENDGLGDYILANASGDYQSIIKAVMADKVGLINLLNSLKSLYADEFKVSKPVVSPPEADTAVAPPTDAPQPPPPMPRPAPEAAWGAEILGLFEKAESLTRLKIKRVGATPALLKDSAQTVKHVLNAAVSAAMDFNRLSDDHQFVVEREKMGSLNIGKNSATCYLLAIVLPSDGDRPSKRVNYALIRNRHRWLVIRIGDLEEVMASLSPKTYTHRGPYGYTRLAFGPVFGYSIVQQMFESAIGDEIASGETTPLF